MSRSAGYRAWRSTGPRPSTPGPSYIGIIDKVVEEYDTYKMYFMNIACDYALATLYVDFGKDILADKMGWKSTVILQEDTAFGGGVQELVAELLAPESGIEVLDTIVYDTQTVDFGPIFNKAAAMKPDFMYLISSVNSQVPVPMTGINVAAFGLDFWNDTGGAGGGTSTLSPIPAAGMELDDVSRAFADKYMAKYGGSRPIFPPLQRFQRLSRGEERRRRSRAGGRFRAAGRVGARDGEHRRQALQGTDNSGIGTRTGSRARSSLGPAASTRTTSSST